MTNGQLRKWSGAAGIAGPILFTTAFVAEGFWQPGYSHVADPVSALAAGPYGWVQDVNFVVFGVLTIAFAIGVHRALRPSRAGTIGSTFLLVSGAALVLAAVFPARDASGAVTDQPGHVLAAVLAFLGAGIGFAAVSRRLARHPHWRDLAGYTLISGIATIVLFLTVGATAIPPDAPLHAWLGAGQRLTLLVWLPCTVVLSLRMLRTTSERQEVDHGHPTHRSAARTR